ncbi:hypothetical protein M408DRAFT_71269 [Serendipita vermifera MAFF 305830]|uniref:Topoisomerase I damage affected protein 2 n=1 Tax=Serendipita vermifera MAFF 305830 TaxID=933852 RepID=A0A0C3AST7_SERVB|nr:hypothetical protein M408DRAFT_71269 [Serendipita vermifera MAFF 305830]
MNSRVLSPTFSTPSHRSSIASSRPKPKKFDAEGLTGYMKHLLSSTLSSQRWPELKERDKVKAWCQEIGERVKERMLHIEPQGFKYIVTTQIYEKLGQGGRADLSCHWEDTDTVAQAMFDNETLICFCIAFAVRTSGS